MKKTTEKIIHEFPYLKGKIEEVIQGPFTEASLETVETEADKTFIRLAYYFEYPNWQGFSLSFLYQHLDNDWLEFALKLITHFFAEDTFLIHEPAYSVIFDGREYMGQSDFGRYLEGRGLNYSRSKMAVYKERGKLPNADVMIGGTSYWKKETVEKYANTLLEQ